MTEVPYTVDEIMSVCIARQVVDGEIVAQGINTPLVMAGVILAKLTHAPRLTFATAIGQAIASEWAPLSIVHIEDAWLSLGLYHTGFGMAAAELLPKFKPKEFFRPAQVDAAGSTNNIAFGRDYAKPRMRLPGSGGIPDVSPVGEHAYLYVPRHSPVTFVETLDYVSGVGHVPQRTHGAGPHYCITDLGEFDWANGRVRVISLHPGVTLAHVQRKTGFALEVAPALRETAPPSPEELRLLREVIDPLNVRKLETLGGTARKDLLREIINREAQRPD
jgi:glutaconate CoA-transferase subunit B